MNGKEIKTKGVARKTGRADFRAVKAPCLWASAQPEISLREEINFLPGENKFLCGRKNIFLREKINLYTGRNSGACGSRKNERRKQGYGGRNLSETQPTNRKVKTEKKLRRGAELSISITKH